MLDWKRENSFLAVYCQNISLTFFLKRGFRFYQHLIPANVYYNYQYIRKIKNAAMSRFMIFVTAFWYKFHVFYVVASNQSVEYDYENLHCLI